MANTAAKKKRFKLQREGKRNPELNRSHWNGVVPIEKKKPTLTERIGKIENKHKKWNRSRHGDDSIFYFIMNVVAAKHILPG